MVENYNDYPNQQQLQQHNQQMMMAMMAGRPIAASITSITLFTQSNLPLNTQDALTQ